MKILHESDEILVRVNSSDEIFVLHKRTNVEIRISRWSDLIVYAWQNCKFTPTAHNGLSAFLCEPRNPEVITREGFLGRYDQLF